VRLSAVERPLHGLFGRMSIGPRVGRRSDKLTLSPATLACRLPIAGLFSGALISGVTFSKAEECRTSDTELQGG
jgi:hypothetical protein